MRAPVLETEAIARRPKALSYAIAFAAILALIVVIHVQFLNLPYFWDELGQFVPAALDILHTFSLIPYSTVPNVHPPGVMLYLALVWKIFGYSIPATRVAMLFVAAVGVYASFLLSIRLSRDHAGAPAFLAILLLVVTPLFYTQAMMAQLDMPAMTLTVVALLLFLEDRFAWSALACAGLVLVKETGAIAPALFAVWLVWKERRWKEAVYFVLPAIPLLAWIFFLWNRTGNILGDAGFAHYNVWYSLHPVRIAISVLRRLFFVFVADFRWIGTLVLLYAMRRNSRLFSGRSWTIATLFFALHLLAMSVFGGAGLERYLLPVFPILYAGMAAAWVQIPRPWRLPSQAACLIGLMLGWLWNSPFPFPFENNLAMADFVELQQAAAEYIEEHAPDATVASAWPYTAALRDPDFGYVKEPIRSVETEDFHASNVISKARAGKANVLVVYSRTWEPRWGVLSSGWIRALLAKYYEYEPQITSDQIQRDLGMSPIIRVARRGQWIQIYSK